MRVNKKIYSPDEIVAEVDASMKMSGLSLTDEEKHTLLDCAKGKLSEDEVKNQLLTKVIDKK